MRSSEAPMKRGIQFGKEEEHFFFKFWTKEKRESEKGKKFEMEEEIERCQREGLDLFVRALPSEHKSQEDFSALRKQKNFVTVNAYFAFSPPLRPNLTVVTYKVFPLIKNDLFYVFKNNLQSVRIVRKW